MRLEIIINHKSFPEQTNKPKKKKKTTKTKQTTEPSLQLEIKNQRVI